MQNIDSLDGKLCIAARGISGYVRIHHMFTSEKHELGGELPAFRKPMNSSVDI